MPFGLCNAPATFQRCMTAIFHELIEDSMEVFMDDFSVFGSSFDHCLKNLEKMLKRCEETNLVLNWEKCHFMVKEGIVLGHKVSGSGIEVDKAKIEAISKLPYPTNVKVVRSFLGHADWSLPFEIMCDASDYAVRAVLGQRIDKHFKPIHYADKTMNEAQENYTTNKKELLAVVFAFDKFWQYLVLSKTIFDIKIRDKKGAENLAVDHLSQLENPDLGKLTRAEIRDLFPKERLMAISDKDNEPWYTDYANYLASRVLLENIEDNVQLKYFTFGRHLEELHVTWAHLEKKQTRLQTYSNATQDNVLSSWRRRMDNANFTRKRSKPDKHGHETVKSVQEPGECFQGQPKSSY
ncbi:reverse transcriptase domain-containing protein [Tanacetum coccineum]